VDGEKTVKASVPCRGFENFSLFFISFPLLLCVRFVLFDRGPWFSTGPV
jgi:hypothetical protein